MNMSVPSARRGPGRPAGGQPVIGRADLLDAAARTIRRIGPNATLDDIAATAGVAKPTVYRVLGDRSAIVSALADVLILRAEQVIVPLRDIPSSVWSPRERFQATIARFLSAMADDRSVFLFVNAGGHDATLLTRVLTQVARGLVEMFTCVAPRPGADRGWAYGMIGAVQASVTAWLIEPWCELEDLAASLTELLWDGLASDPDAAKLAS